MQDEQDIFDSIYMAKHGDVHAAMEALQKLDAVRQVMTSDEPNIVSALQIFGDDMVARMKRTANNSYLQLFDIFRLSPEYSICGFCEALEKAWPKELR